MADEQPVPEKSARFKRRQQRLQRLRETVAVKRVRVSPTSGEIRKVLKHPSVGPFREEGSMEWPYDTFTKRRLQEGSIRLEEERKPQQQARQQSRPRSTAE